MLNLIQHPERDASADGEARLDPDFRQDDDKRVTRETA
jgi:hypothetical protein